MSPSLQSHKGGGLGLKYYFLNNSLGCVMGFYLEDYFLFIFICLSFFISVLVDECTVVNQATKCITPGKTKCDESKNPNKCVGK